jgi:WD40 repeat protein
VAFSPDGKRIVTGTGRRIIVLDAERGRELLSIAGHSRRVGDVAWSSDGNWIASGGLDDRTVKLWDAASGRERRTWQREGFPNRVAFSPDGRRLASLGSKTLTVWYVASGEELLTIREPDARGGAVAFTPDGARLIGAVGRDLRIWDASDGRVLKTLKGHSQGVDHLAVSRDGRRIVTGAGTTVLSAPADYAVRV